MLCFDRTVSRSRAGFNLYFMPAAITATAAITGTFIFFAGYLLAENLSECSFFCLFMQSQIIILNP